MMKKLFTLYTFLLIAMVCRAENVEIDGIWYNLIEKTQQAEVINSPQ